MAKVRQIGPPVIVDGWLIRVTDDADHPNTLAKASLIEQPEKFALVLGDGALRIEGPNHIPPRVLRALLLCGGWQKAVTP